MTYTKKLGSFHHENVQPKDGQHRSRHLAVEVKYSTVPSCCHEPVAHAVGVFTEISFHEMNGKKHAGKRRQMKIDP